MPMCKVESITQLRKRAEERKRLGGKLIVPERPDRPKTRADCAGGVRPCPWVSCKYHLFLEVRQNGSIAYPQGQDLDALERMPQSCVLDVAEQGGASQTDVGKALNASMQMASLVELAALAKLTLDPDLEVHWS
jgi:hypothetical protein